jgi:hypothetical protein
LFLWVLRLTLPFTQASSTKYKQYNIRYKGCGNADYDWLKAGIDVAGFLVKPCLPVQICRCHQGDGNPSGSTYWSFWPMAKPESDIEYGDNPVETATFSAGQE